MTVLASATPTSVAMPETTPETTPAPAATATFRPLGWVWEAALLTPLILAPLPQASVPNAPRALLTSILCLIGIAMLWRLRKQPTAGNLPPGAVAMAGLAAWGFAQLLPLAPPMTELGRSLLGGIQPEHLSLVPAHTASRARELVAAVVLFVVAITVFGRRSTASRLVWALVSLATTLSAYGILVRGGVLPPVVADLPRQVVTATFFNRNHFASLLGLAVLTGIGLLLSHHDSNRRRSVVHAVEAKRRAVLFALCSGVALCALTLLLTESRGGLAALVAGGLTLAVLCRRYDGKSYRAALLVLPALGAAMWCAAPETLTARFAGLGDEWTRAGTRPDIWRGGLDLATAFPIFGTGLGTYTDVSPLTQPIEVPGRIEHAHSDPLQFLTETGIIGLMLLLWAAAAWGRYVWSHLQQTTDTRRARLAAGCAAAVVTMMVHSTVEFNFQIPANTLWCVALAGCAVGLVRPRNTSPKLARWRGTLPRTLVAAVLLAVCTVAGAEAGSAWLGDTTDAARLALADSWHRRDGSAAIRAGRAKLESGDLTAAAALARAGLERNPLSPTGHRLLGRALLRQDATAAHRAFENALRLTNAFDRPRHQHGVASDYLAAGLLQEGLAWIHDLLQHHPQLADKVLSELYQELPAYELIESAVPDDPEVRRVFTVLLARVGEFHGREVELAKQRGEPLAPSHITIRDGIALVRREISETTGAGRRMLEVVLGFQIAADATIPPPLVLRFEGPGAAVYRSFTIAQEPFRFPIDIEPNFPPGRYRLSLEFQPLAARLPLGTVDVERTDLELRFHDVLDATHHLNWTTAEPGARQHPRRGLPLHAGDLLWRDVQGPRDDGVLVVVCDRPADLAVRVGHHTLESIGVTNADTRRYRLPGDSAGRLEIRCDDRRPPTIEKLLVLPGDTPVTPPRGDR